MDTFKVPVAITKAPISEITCDSDTNTSNNTALSEPPVNKVSNKLAALDAKCPYEEPEWSAPPTSQVEYKFEVLKSGTIVESIDNLEKKAYWVFGRLPSNDIVMAHPTISRFHAVLQFRPNPEGEDSNRNGSESHDVSLDDKFSEGWYIFDLGSTHGTFLNKMRIPPKTYIPVRVGHMITLGASTRKYILQGPEYDEEPESELTVTELKERRIREEEERIKQEEIQQELREKEGINWGMSEDADEETDLTVNPYASTNNEELFLDDPKKTLRGFFEREGYDLDYKVDEMSPGTFICRIELPIDDENGRPIVAEVCHKGKKKDCVVQGALEACRILDRHGVLRQSHHEPMKRRAPKEDSDEDDDFLDRTGDVERKKLRKAHTGQTNTLTYDDLLKQETELSGQLSVVKDKIMRYHEEHKRTKEKEAEENDDLDEFMKNLSHDKEIDKTEIRKLRVEENRLEAEYQKLQRLIKVAKPTQLPSLKTSDDSNDKKKAFFPLFGKRNKTRFQLPPKAVPVKKVETKELQSDEEEMEDEEPEVAKSSVPVEISTTTTETASIADTETTSRNSEKEAIIVDIPLSPSSKPIKGPAVIPAEILNSIQKPQPVDSPIADEPCISRNEEDADAADSITNELSMEEHDNRLDDAAGSAKRKRNRNRNRIKGRENVDIDDKEEFDDKEKYSGWVPPENQTGDGITSLNKKFGY